MTDDSAQHLAIMRARNKAFRWPKGTSGRTPLARCYHQARGLARRSSPEMMEVLIGLASDDEVEPRVRSVCAMAVLDRAGIRPIDFDPNEGKDEGFDFNPRDYTREELDAIEAALRLMVAKRDEKRRQQPAGLGAERGVR
jgi:hypothetical protein